MSSVPASPSVLVTKPRQLPFLQAVRSSRGALGPAAGETRAPHLHAVGWTCASALTCARASLPAWTPEGALSNRELRASLPCRTPWGLPAVPKDKPACAPRPYDALSTWFATLRATSLHFPPVLPSTRPHTHCHLPTPCSSGHCPQRQPSAACGRSGLSLR